MDDNVDDKFSLKSDYGFVNDDFLKRQTEPMIKAQEMFKSSIEPFWNKIQTADLGIQTIGQKIEPLLKVQQNISDSILAMNTRVSGSVVFDPYKTSLISGAALKLGETIGNIQELAIKSGVMFQGTDYNFIKQPVVSALNFVADDVALQQKALIYGMGDLAKFNIDSVQKVSDLINGSYSIDSISLESIQKSPFLFSQTLPMVPEKKDNISERISKLEEEVKDLKNKKAEIIFDDFVDGLEILLENIDSSGFLIKKFKGARDVINQNDDSLAQSAESMTRLIEQFPFYLNKNYKLKGEKNDGIREILAIHLGIKYKGIKDIAHPLIDQQNYFYTTFSQIRHGNKEIYESFEKDPAMYKGLVIQALGFLYQIIKS